MNIKQLFQDEDAVSPVIGVILMVAITVILAAVIGTFVLGLGDQVQSSAPNANFQFEYGSVTYTESTDTVDLTTVTITHNGGQDVEGDNVRVQVGGGTAYGVTSNTDGSASAPFSGTTLSTGTSGTYVFYDSGSSFSTGDALNVVSGGGDLDGDAAEFSGGDDVLVIWESPNGDSSNTIGSSTVPN